ALTGAKIELLESNEDRSVMRARVKRILGGEQLLYETNHYRKDGTRVSLEVSAKAIKVEEKILIQYFLRDNTERKMLEAQVLQSQKLDSIGSFAGGIAHNFNNILTAILGYTEVLRSSRTLDELSRQRIRSIEACARKAGVMVSSLLDFTRHARSKMAPLNMNEVVRESMRLVEGFLDPRINLKMFLDPATPLVDGDDNRLEQVIMNVISNARDAMPDGGTITVRTAEVEAGNEKRDMQVCVPRGKYALLKISDTGCGIPQHMISKVFDPFFTTKEKGKGTGLGLAMVYGIIRDHNGHIAVQSEVGKGTCLDIYLPASIQNESEDEEPELVSLKGQENILLVDDDEDVLDFVRDILETNGYTVLSVNNPVSAVDLFDELSGKIPLMITDSVMPLMDGSELAARLKRISPSVKVVVISGFGGRDLKRDDGLIDAFLKKPFEVTDLLLTIRRLLKESEKNAHH
ncbi:MAG TPA: ATP-binding protein, partial [Thermodesulfovibrionales bacterium]|nr:ATP-binding protein [Thermodesulfovibrionales bacterium]